MLRAALLLAGLLVVLLPSAISRAAPSGSGGALAEPVQQGSGGGHAAPAAPEAPAASTDAVVDDAQTDGGVEAAAPSQEPDGEIPTTPEGGEQPNGDIPEDDTGAGDEEIIGPVGEVGENGAGGGGEVSGGFLPFTGLRLALLAALGLALLTAGLALRPAARR
jgi:hypothetical protein